MKAKEEKLEEVKKKRTKKGDDEWNDAEWQRGVPRPHLRPGKRGAQTRRASDPIGNMYTHLLSHVHFLGTACTFPCVHTRVGQGCEKALLHAHVVSLHLAFSLLMFHPSSPLSSDNFYDTAYQYLTFTDLLLGLSRSKSASPANLRNGEEDFGFMSNMHHSTKH